MATVCELSTTFEELLITLYEKLLTNLQQATQWGTVWDIVHQDTLEVASGKRIRHLWGFTSAFQHTDGLGGRISFWVQFTESAQVTEVLVKVASPYEGVGNGVSKHYRRAHAVALRLLEFCVAPYEEIHPSLATLKRLAGGTSQNDISPLPENL
ncbi:MAG: hypothetical protein ACOYL5_11605 [Phototrophicaceae bacterium]